MSDEEEYSEEEEYEESEAAEEPEAAAPKDEPAEPEPTAEAETEEPEEPEAEEAQSDRRVSKTESEAPKLRRVERPAQKDGDGQNDGGHTLTEAEQAMLDAKRRHEAEAESKAQESEERRKQELQQVEQELIELKQRQEERKKEREVEEREFAERRKKDDERRRAEEEDRKARVEAAKRAKEEEKLKRQQMMAGSFVTTTVGNKRKEQSAEKIAELKRNYIASIQKADVSNLLPNDLKAKIKQLHSKILRLEHDKYDLEQRHQRQDYDLKELEERKSQQTRNKALALGVEVEQAESGQVRPPKVNVASKHDRQKDHRSYKDRFDKFEHPVEKPDPSIAHGSGRPPPEWGRSKTIDELETIRKNLEPPQNRYKEIAPVEGAKPPVDVIPLQIPTE